MRRRPFTVGAIAIGALGLAALALLGAGTSGEPGARAAALMSSPAISASPTPTLVPLGPDTAAALQATLEAARDHYEMPGVSVAIVWPDGRTWTGTSGKANLRTGAAAGRSTVFAVASMTKTFTAALILRLAEEGRLSLDDPLSHWVPEFRYAAGITLRQLLSHTSGLYDYFTSVSLDAALRADKKRIWTPADVLRYVRKPYFAPGAGYAYSNTNYLLLGLVAERATGASYAALLRSRFLDPLGLRSAYLQGYEPARGRVSKGYAFASLSASARAVEWTDGTAAMPFTSVATAAWSAGGLAMTASDLARWTRALFTGGVLPPASLNQMLAYDRAAGPGAAPSYGLGMGRVLLDGRLAWGHSGRLAGFRGVLRYLPDSGVTIVVLTNQDRWDPDRVARKLLDVIVPRPPKPTPSPTLTAAPSQAAQP